MLYNKTHKKEGLIKKIYLTIILFVFVAMLIGCGAMYLNFQRIGTSIITTTHREGLNHISTTAKTITQTGQNLVLQVFRDPDVIPLMYGKNPEANEISKALIRLDAYKASTPYVHSIYVYNERRDEFYTTLPSEGIQTKKSFFDQEIVAFLEGLNTYDLSYPIVREIEDRVQVVEQDTIPVYSFIMYDGLYSSYSEMGNAVVVNIDQKWMKELIDKNNQAESLFIIDQEGNILVNLREDGEDQETIETTYIRQIIEESQANGSFVDETEGKQRLVNYVSVDELSNWIFVATHEYGELMQPLHTIRNVMFVVIAIGISVTSLLGKVASEKLYKPVRKLEESIDELKQEKKQEVYHLKQLFLGKIIQESLPYSKHMIDQQLEKYKINLNTNLSSKLVLVSIDHYKALIQQQNKEQQEHINYSLVNICEELGNNRFGCSVIELSNGLFISIINSLPDWGEEVFDQHIEVYLEEMKDTIQSVLNLSISCVVSENIEDFSLLPEIYREVMHASKYKMFNTEQCTIYTCDIRQVEEKSYIYSDKEYNLLFMSIKQGQVQEAKKLYKKIMDYVGGYSYVAYQSTILHLAYSLNLMITTINEERVEKFVHEPAKFVKLISSAEYAYEVDRTFLSLFEELAEFIKQTEQSKSEKDYDNLVQSIYEILNESYTDIDICVQSIADQLKMSAPYIGRIFTKYTGNTITQYINDKRIEKAEYLLISTKDAIADISDQCGFSNITYFYKKFKITTGVTPSVYRELHTNKEKSS